MTYSDKGEFKKRILISKITEELKMDILNMNSVLLKHLIIYIGEM